MRRTYFHVTQAEAFEAEYYLARFTGRRQRVFRGRVLWAIKEAGP